MLPEIFNGGLYRDVARNNAVKLPHGSPDCAFLLCADVSATIVDRSASCAAHRKTRRHQEAKAFQRRNTRDVPHSLHRGMVSQRSGIQRPQALHFTMVLIVHAPIC